jgi:hypothetical protein
MKIHTRLGLIIMAVWVIAWSASNAAAATITVDKNTRLEKHYYNDSFVITQSNVELDCNHYIIRGPAPHSKIPGRGIYAMNVDNVTIKNCEVNNWNVGISINGGSGHRVYGVHLHDNTYGLTLSYTQSVEMSRSPKNDNIIEGNEYGLYLARASSTTIKETSIEANTRTGLRTYDAVGALHVEFTYFTNNGGGSAEQDAAGLYIARSTKDFTLNHVVFTNSGPMAGCGMACHLKCEETPLDPSKRIPHTATGVVYSPEPNNPPSGCEVLPRLPMSGSEPPFEPEKWNFGDTQKFNNCYNYACNQRTDTRAPAQPGTAGGMRYSKVTCEDVTRAAQRDGMQVADCDQACPAGSYKTALVVGGDYHWYRQDCDGTWSQKVGDEPATNVDASGRRILDPRTADRRGPEGINYKTFCGCFCCNPQVVRVR